MSSSTLPIKHSVLSKLRIIEQWAGVICLFFLILLQLLSITLRTIGTGILGLNNYITHFLLLFSFIAGITTMRTGKHLTIAGIGLLPHKMQKWAQRLTIFLAVSILVAFMWSSIGLVSIGFDSTHRIGMIPTRLFVLIMPISYLCMALYASTMADTRAAKIGLAFVGIIAGTIFAYSAVYDVIVTFSEAPAALFDTLLLMWDTIMIPLSIPLVVLLIMTAFFGTPLFVILGGVAFFLFVNSGGSLAIISNEGYNMLTDSSIPAVALFAFAGYILSESKAGERLVNFFRACFGWLPGGIVITVVLASVFFTSFTGASGITIIALGGLLFSILKKSGHYADRFSVGLLTSVSHVGLLFPPSLAIIIYGTIAQVRIDHLFLAGLLPGTLITVVFCVIGVGISIRNKIALNKFSWKKTLAALEASWPELFLPFMIIGAFIGGPPWIVTFGLCALIAIWAIIRKKWSHLITIPLIVLAFFVKPTTVELATIAVIYIFIVEVFVYRDVHIRQLSGIAIKCATILGGIFMILAAARALSFYIVDINIPAILQSWVADSINSKLIFLLILNVILLIAGCFMDIFSAILVVVPLVTPLGVIFGIDPVHLGIIFLANLGVGFITPPVGINLFLASYRFEKPLVAIYRNVVPFFLIQIVTVLIITYVPQFSTWLPNLLSR